MRRLLLILLPLLFISCTTQDGVLKQVEPGSLKIVESSGKDGLVFLNGVLRDTLASGECSLPDVESGSQEVILFAPNCELDTQKVEVKSGEISELSFGLSSAESGSIAIKRDSGSSVKVAGLSFGALTSSGELKLQGFPTGEHTISVKNGSKSLDTTITLTKDDQIILNAQLTLQQQVLIEHISNVSCEYCPHHAEVMYHILDSLGWKNISKISYNANWPAPDDPLYLFEPKPQMDRAMLYGAEVQYALPIFVVNGKVLKFNADNEKLAAELISTIAAEQAEPPAFNIELTNSSVTVRAIGEENFSGTVRVNLVQDRVTFEEAPGSNGEKEFLNTFRRLLLDESITVESGGSVTKTFTVDSSNLPSTGLRLTAFIQDKQNMVHQTADLTL